MSNRATFRMRVWWSGQSALLMACVLANLGCENHCKDTGICEEFGQCKPKGEECVAVSDDDCRESKWCLKRGACYAGKDGQCEARDDADCKRTKQCTVGGACKAQDGACKTTDATCSAGKWCKTSGYCSGGGADCALSADGCAKADACKEKGACGYVPASTTGPCADKEPPKPTRMRDLEATDQNWGRQDEVINEALRDGRRQMERRLLCAAHCAPRNDADCAQSAGCRSGEACKLKPGEQAKRHAECVSEGAAK